MTQQRRPRNTQPSRREGQPRRRYESSGYDNDGYDERYESNPYDSPYGARAPRTRRAANPGQTGASRRQPQPYARRTDPRVTRRASAAYAAHAPAHSRRLQPEPRRRAPILPIVLALIVLVVVGIVAVLFLRSCGGSGTTAGNAAAGDAASQAQEGAELQDGTAQDAEGTTAAAKAKDGSVDINLLMVGDILFHYQVRMSGLQSDGSRNYDHVFAHVLDELEDKDIKVLNQETPLGGPLYTGTAPDGYDGYPEFNGPQEMADAEAKAGFNVVLKATNHAMDNSGNFSDPYTLIRSEQSYWHENYPNVAVIGQANLDDEDSTVEDVYVYEKDGFKVALLNYTQDLNGNEGFDVDGIVSMLENEHVKSTMQKANELADMVVVFPHWGEEYNLEPVEMQYEWAQAFADLGADVIIGNHPHVIEPVTVVTSEDGQKVPCYWSTGNFISTSPSDESLVGGIAEVTLHKDADGDCSVTSAAFKPVISHLGLSTDMTTYLITDWTDDLASTNWLDTEVNANTDNTTLTPAWANAFCKQVLGSDYDEDKGVLELEL